MTYLDTLNKSSSDENEENPEIDAYSEEENMKET